jgi:Tol biopolymer transport system component
MLHRAALVLLTLTAIAPLSAAGAEAPAGPRLALLRLNTSIRGGTGIDLVTAGPDGGARQLVTGSSVRRGVVPVTTVGWSNDGQTLAFGGSKYVGAVDSDLYVINSDGSGLRRLTRVGDVGAPVFSPDGATIYFTRRPSISSSIWAINRDGSGLRQLLPAQKLVVDKLTSISPSGDLLGISRVSCRLVTSKYRCGSSAQALSLATGQLKVLAEPAANPVFSPDGLRIALTSTRDHNGEVRVGNKPTPAAELYVLDLATGALTRMTWSHDLDEQIASWDPTGTRLAFDRADSINYVRTVEVNADSSCRLLLFRRRVRKRDVEFGTPAWQPGPGRGAGPIAC